MIWEAEKLVLQLRNRGATAFVPQETRKFFGPPEERRQDEQNGIRKILRALANTIRHSKARKNVIDLSFPSDFNSTRTLFLRIEIRGK